MASKDINYQLGKISASVKNIERTLPLIHADIKEIRKEQMEIKIDVNENSTAREQTNTMQIECDKRFTDLESFRNRAYGVVTALAFTFGALGSYVALFLKKLT